MSDDARMRLTALLQGFVEGTDRSLRYLDQIEGLLITAFVDTDLFEELSPYLASYRPGGGTHLYNEEQLALEFRYVLARYLEYLSGCGSHCRRGPHAYTIFTLQA